MFFSKMARMLEGKAAFLTHQKKGQQDTNYRFLCKKPDRGEMISPVRFHDTAQSGIAVSLSSLYQA